MNFNAISLNQEKIRKPSYIHIVAFMFNCPIFSRTITNAVMQLLKIIELIIQRKQLYLENAVMMCYIIQLMYPVKDVFLYDCLRSNSSELSKRFI